MYLNIKVTAFAFEFHKMQHVFNENDFLYEHPYNEAWEKYSHDLQGQRSRPYLKCAQITIFLKILINRCLF